MEEARAKGGACSSTRHCRLSRLEDRMLRTPLRATSNRTATVTCAVLFLTAVFTCPAQAQQAARIDTVTPAQAATGQAVTITGIGFGARNVRITVGGIPAQVVSATG